MLYYPVICFRLFIKNNYFNSIRCAPSNAAHSILSSYARLYIYACVYEHCNTEGVAQQVHCCFDYYIMAHKQHFVQFPWNKFIACTSININKTSHFNGAYVFLLHLSHSDSIWSCCYPLKSLFIQFLSVCLCKKR